MLHKRSIIIVCALCKYTSVAEVKKYDKLSESDKEDVLGDIRWDKGFNICECNNVTCKKCTIQVEPSIGGISGMYMCKSCADDTCNSIKGEKYCKVCNCFFTDGNCKCK